MNHTFAPRPRWLARLAVWSRRIRIRWAGTAGCGCGVGRELDR